MPVRRIEVSLFAADRGGAIARQFANSLVTAYRRRNDEDLAIVDGEHIIPIRIRFMGLFDSVASIMEVKTPCLICCPSWISSSKLQRPSARCAPPQSNNVFILPPPTSFGC